MKICFLGPASSSHIIKWCDYFVRKNYDVHVISFENYDIQDVHVHTLLNSELSSQRDIAKIRYLFEYKKVKMILEDIKPDILSVHYATSYGTLAALSGWKRYSLSIWGSDIYDFPQKSIFHKMLLKYSLGSATKILSTSKAMAHEASQYTNKRITITPFGVDMEMFSPEKRERGNDSRFIVGTVKALTPKYGINYLIEAVSIVKKEDKSIPIEVRIAGKGESEEQYKQLCKDLEIEEIVHWLGFIPVEQAAKEWANMDVAIIPSVLESFGVSAVEAQASGIPVIISNIPGLQEATHPESSIVVDKRNAKAIADAIVLLYEDKMMREEMGKCGRQNVKDNYEIGACFMNIENELLELLKMER